jgi:DNA-binding beta-propeller fold protein YncE
MQNLYSFAKSFLGLACLVLCFSTGAAVAQTSTFTYQGRLTDNGTPANAIFDLQFKLYDTATVGTGALQGSPDTVTNPSVQVTDGVFTVQLDFGAPAFSGGDRFLEINVRHPGDPSYTTLAPRQQLTSSPYSVRTLSATTADSLSSACNGCVLNAHIQSLNGDKVIGLVPLASFALNAGTATSAVGVTGVVQIANGGTGSFFKNFVDLGSSQTVGGNKQFTGAVSVTGANGVFNGNGAGLSNLNSANLTGVVQIANGGTGSPTKNFVDLFTNQNISGDKEFFGAVSVTGSNGVFNGNGAGLSNLNAANLTGVVQIGNGGTGSSTKNFVDLSTSQNIGGDKQFTGAVSVTGASGVFNGNGAGLSNLNGSNLADASITASKIAPNVILNPHKLALLQWFDVNRSMPAIPVSGSPSALAFDGTFIYVAHNNNGSVARIRASTGVVEGSLIPVGSFPSALAFDGTFIYVANFASNNVTRIRASTGLVEGSSIAVGSGPDALAFDGTFVYVANYTNGSVTRIRASTGLVEGNAIAVGPGPSALAFDGTFIYVTSGNNVARIRASTGQVEGSPIAVGILPQALAFDGTFIYVANYNSGSVTRIRASTGVVEGSPIAVGSNPIALAFDGTFICVANYNNSSVTRIRTSTGVVEGSPIAVGTNPRALAFDGTFIYVGNAGTNNVTRF